MSALLHFPWPPKELSPNARIHWAKKARAFKSYKDACCWLNKGRRGIKGTSRFKVTFVPPDKRKYDLDGLISRIKPGIDALSVLTGVDDYNFELAFSRADPIFPGRVLVEVIG